MTPRTFYLTVVAPFVAWLVIDPLLSARLAWMADSERTAGLADRLVFLGFLWAQRMTMPFAMVGAAIAAPLLTLAAVWLVRPASPSRRWALASTLPWFGVLGISWLAVIGAALSERSRGSVFVFLIWSATAADAIIIAVAFRLQASLNAEGRSKIAARFVLWLGVLLQLLWVAGSLVAAVPLAATVRARRRTTHVTSADV